MYQDGFSPRSLPPTPRGRRAASGKAREKREAEEAKIRAEKEAKEAAERAEAEMVAKEIAEAERKARVQALKPDKEKLEAWANTVLDIPAPEGIQDRKIMAIAEGALSLIYSIANDAIAEVRAL